MNIECPSCSTKNKIEYSENILCSHCNKSFAGHYYKKFKKPLISATTALVIGVVGTHQVGKHFNSDQRYPIRIEYELVGICLDSSNISISRKDYSAKKEICICALEKTMHNLSYEEMQKDDAGFLTIFDNSIMQCK